MVKSTRRKLFYALVAVFLILGTGVVLYAEGWRVDFARWRIDKAGGIFVRAYPENAAVTLDGEPIRSQIGLISRGTLINGLMPRTYTLTLALPGYDAWQESAAVNPAIVTEFKYAVLVPESPATTSAASVKAFGITPNGLALETAAGIVMNGKPISSGTLIEANPSSPFLLYRAPSGRYFLLDTGTSAASNLSSLFAANGVALASASIVLENPYHDPPQIVAADAARLSIVDVTTQGLLGTERALSGKIFSTPPTLSSSWVAWAIFNPSQNLSSIDRYDIGADIIRHGSSTVPGKIAKLARVSDSRFAALQDAGILYTYDADADRFAKLADNIADIAASDDGAMLAARSSHSLEVFSLGTDDYWRFNLPDLARIRKLIWYRDDRHLFVTYPDHVSFLDLADASLSNFTTVTEGSMPAYDPGANALYVLDRQHAIARFDFPN